MTAECAWFWLGSASRIVRVRLLPQEVILGRSFLHGLRSCTLSIIPLILHIYSSIDEGMEGIQGVHYTPQFRRKHLRPTTRENINQAGNVRITLTLRRVRAPFVVEVQ